MCDERQIPACNATIRGSKKYLAPVYLFELQCFTGASGASDELQILQREHAFCQPSAQTEFLEIPRIMLPCIEDSVAR